MGCSWVAHGLLMGLSWDALGELYPQDHEFAMKKGCPTRGTPIISFLTSVVLTLPWTKQT